MSDKYSERLHSDPRSTDELIQLALDETDYDKYIWYLELLDFRGDDEVFNKAVELCKDEDIYKRRSGADILGQLGRPDSSIHQEETLELLRKMLNDEDNFVVQAVSSALRLREEPNTEDKQFLRKFIRQVDKDDTISNSEIKSWMSSKNPDVLGAINYLLFERESIYRIKPHLSENEIKNFLFRLYEYSIRENPEGEWALLRFDVMLELVSWYKSEEFVFRDYTKFLYELKDFIAQEYIHGDEETKESIICAALEHILEQPKWRIFFEDWKQNPVLAEAYDKAMEWSVDHEKPDISQTEMQTLNKIPEILNDAVKSSQYQYGGAYLSNPIKLEDASSMEKDAYSYRLVIDFLRSLKPEQISLFQNKQTLPFKKLNKEQQKMLFQLYAIENGDFIHTSFVNESFIMLEVIFTDDEIFNFLWNRPVVNPNGADILFYMGFSKYGKIN